MKTHRQRKLKQAKRLRRAEIISLHQSYCPTVEIKKAIRQFAEEFNRGVGRLLVFMGRLKS